MQSQKSIIAYLIFRNHPELTEKLPLFEGDNILGRVPDKSSVVIKHNQISSCHAKIKITNTKIILTDMGSKNGTFPDVDAKEQRLQKGIDVEIKQNQIIALGQVECFVQRIPQARKESVSPQKRKQVQQKKPNLLMQLDELTQNQSKMDKKKNQQDSNSSIDSSLFGKNLKKGTQKTKKSKQNIPQVQQAQDESDLSESQIQIPKINIKQVESKKQKQTRQKITKQKEEKQKREKKEKQLKDKKLKQQKQKKEKQEQSKKLKQEKEKRQRQEKQNEQQLLRQEKEKKQEEERVKFERQKKIKQEQQKKKKGDVKKEKITSKNQLHANDEYKNKKNRPTKSVSNDKKQKKLSRQKSKQKSQTSIQSQNSQFSNQKKQKKSKEKTSQNQKKIKQTKDEKKEKLNKKQDKKQIKTLLKVQKKSLNKSDSKSKSNRSQKSRQKPELATKNRKKIPVEEQNENEQEGKRYRLRQKLLKITKFKISGDPIKYHTTPILKHVEDEDEDYDVLVMDNFIRTYKLLYSISRGIPIVKKSWLTDSEICKKASQVDCHWLEYPGDKWLIKRSVQKVKYQDFHVFKDMEFYIASKNENLHLDNKKLERLIYNGGGSVILFSTKMKSDKNFARKVYVLLENQYDDDELERAKSINKDNIYDIELILQCTLTQRLDLESHKLDV